MLTVTSDAPLRPLNTMGIDGRVATLVEWDMPSDLIAFFNSEEYEGHNRGRVKQIGEGSNLLFLNPCIDTTLLVSRYKAMEKLREGVYRVGAGVKLDDLVAVTTGLGLWGLENLALIPGTTGAAAVQNVGAYGREFGEIVMEVKCYDRSTGGFVTLSHDEIGYGYRESIFKHEPAGSRYIITDVTIRLKHEAMPCLSHGRLKERVGESPCTPDDVRRAVAAIRREVLPQVDETGSAGSFFKNPIIPESQLERVSQLAARHGIEITGMPVFASDEGRVKLSAAWLIDRAGWKGVTRGNVGTWPRQPLVIVNLTGHASGTEVATLATDIATDVKYKFGVELHTEVEYL